MPITHRYHWHITSLLLLGAEAEQVFIVQRYSSAHDDDPKVQHPRACDSTRVTIHGQAPRGRDSPSPPDSFESFLKEFGKEPKRQSWSSPGRARTPYQSPSVGDDHADDDDGAVDDDDSSSHRRHHSQSVPTQEVVSVSGAKKRDVSDISAQFSLLSNAAPQAQSSKPSTLTHTFQKSPSTPNDHSNSPAASTSSSSHYYFNDNKRRNGGGTGDSSSPPPPLERAASSVLLLTPGLTRINHDGLLAHVFNLHDDFLYVFEACSAILGAKYRFKPNRWRGPPCMQGEAAQLKGAWCDSLDAQCWIGWLHASRRVRIFPVSSPRTTSPRSGCPASSVTSTFLPIFSRESRVVNGRLGECPSEV